MHPFGLCEVAPGEFVYPGPGGLLADRATMRIIFSLLLCQLLAGSPGYAGAPAAQVPGADPLGERKIEFMLNLVEFVEWPAGYLIHPEQPLVLGVIGDDAFWETLVETTSGKRVNGRRVELRRFQGAMEESSGRRQEDLTARRVKKLQDLRSCHILFLGGSERAHVPMTLKGLKGAPVLTVGDTDMFTGQGGMIGLVPQGGNLRLEINPEEARLAALKISSKLLALARVVNTQVGDR